MSSVFDVADYILKRMGKLPAMKLQKLVYYTQAWSLVWDDKPLFGARIEAWANGPVVPALFQKHRGQFEVSRQDVGGDYSGLSDKQRETIDAIIAHYGNHSSQWLSDLTHAEKPWKQARQGLAPGERGNQTITLESMAEYYSSL